jgi:hypothetical protein
MAGRLAETLELNERSDQDGGMVYIVSAHGA